MLFLLREVCSSLSAPDFFSPKFFQLIFKFYLPLTLLIALPKIAYPTNPTLSMKQLCLEVINRHTSLNKIDISLSKICCLVLNLLGSELFFCHQHSLSETQFLT